MKEILKRHEKSIQELHRKGEALFSGWGKYNKINNFRIIGQSNFILVSN